MKIGAFCRNWIKPEATPINIWLSFFKKPFMKGLFHNCILTILVMSFCFTACKKEKSSRSNPLSLNITLYNKPLDTIRFYIKGKWECHYGKGGIVANTIHYHNGYYWTFSNDNRIERLNNGTIVTDTTIRWVRDVGTYINGDSTFILSFYDKQNMPWNYVVQGIFNDTLILHDNSADAVFYHFTKR